MLFWVFLLGSAAGFVFEGLWCVFVVGRWENHSATVWGPFCIIYGIGGAAIYVLAYVLRGKGFVTQFAAYMAAGTLVEYLGSLFQELCFGSVSWNYSAHFGNINGRICVVMSLIWGFLGILFSVFLYRPLQKLFMKLNGKAGYITTWLLIVFMSVNLILSCCAVRRWQERLNEQPADSKIDLLLDQYYGNEKMKSIYQNMCFVK